MNAVDGVGATGAARRQPGFAGYTWAGDGPAAAWHEQATREVGAVVWTGLSATVGGHLIRVERDEYSRVARVVVERLPGREPTALELELVACSAALLAGRARRTLGAGWTVESPGAAGG